MTAVVFMYHRICDQEPHTACYFARGTAVTPEVYETQVKWLSKRVPIVSLEAAEKHSPSAVLTFDDGYRDVLELPDAFPKSIFPIAGHLADAARAAFVDCYYGLIHTARCRRPNLTFVEEVIHIPLADAPSLAEDLKWWVRGPLKERLQIAPSSIRWATLDTLRKALDAEVPSAEALYLSKPEIRDLATRGHLIGGHGVSHVRLPDQSFHVLRHEVEGARQLLDELHTSGPRVFAYPDGRFDHRTRDMVAAEGFSYGLTVTSGVWTSNQSRLEVPRVFMKNVWPDSPQWQPVVEILRQAGVNP